MIPEKIGAGLAALAAVAGVVMATPAPSDAFETNTAAQEHISMPPGGSTPAIALVRSQLWLVDELTVFQSPSGNVGCSIEPMRVRCDIAERSWGPLPRPADCHPNVSSGQGLDLDAGGESGVVCAGDSVLGFGDILPYGDAIQAGSLQCDSTEAAMTCHDRTSRHGFTLSRQGYELF